MNPLVAGAEPALPAAIVDVVTTSVEKTYPAFFSEKPLRASNSPDAHHGPCIAGIISFIGEMSWSLSWILTKDTAPVLAKRFAGFDIPFDSSDMADMAGELVNVIAGEVVAQMEQRNIKAQMSLPTIARGNPLELVPASGPSIVNLDYSSKEGPFWFRIAAARHPSTRISGR